MPPGVGSLHVRNKNLPFLGFVSRYHKRKVESAGNAAANVGGVAHSWRACGSPMRGHFAGRAPDPPTGGAGQQGSSESGRHSRRLRHEEANYRRNDVPDHERHSVGRLYPNLHNKVLADRQWSDAAGHRLHTTTIEDHDYNVHLDHESKDINLDHESKTATVKRLGFSLLPTIGQVGQPIKGIIGGRAVTGVRSAGFSPGRHSSSCEDWIADDLRVLVHSECKFEDGSGILQQMHNIEEREPDPALFRIPEGYSVVTCETQHANPDEPHVNPPWHCRQEKSGEKKR
jgi:hypothetical protein